MCLHVIVANVREKVVHIPEKRALVLVKLYPDSASVQGWVVSIFTILGLKSILALSQLNLTEGNNAK
jgi:hypothetical protein